MGTIPRNLLMSSFLAVSLAAGAQERKPGLYEVTLTTTTSAPSSGTRTRVSEACLTPEMIDKYGAIVPQNLEHICQLINVVKKPGGMTADITCSGALVGKGGMEVNWPDSEHSTGNLRFSGSLHPGDKEIKIEWSAATKSTYKGPDCGELKPAPTPAPPASPAPPATPPSQ